jgi:glutathione S-transferase
MRSLAATHSQRTRSHTLHTKTLHTKTLQAEPQVPPSAPAGASAQEVAEAAGDAPRDEVRYSAAALPALTAAACSLTGTKLHFAAQSSCGLPCLALASGESITGDHAIARFVVRSNASTALLGYSSSSTDTTADATAAEAASAVASAQVDQWLDACLSHSSGELRSALEPFLQSRTFLAGHSLTLADVAVYTKLSDAPAAVSTLQGNNTDSSSTTSSSASSSSDGSAVARWSAMLSALPEVATAVRLIKSLAGLAARPAAAAAATSSKKSATVSANGGAGDSSSVSGKKGGKKGDNKAIEEDTGGALPPLEGAVEGAVMTRFPPEPRYVLTHNNVMTVKCHLVVVVQCLVAGCL